MTDKRTLELAEQFDDLTIKKMMKILAYKAANTKLYFKEIMDEFEKTLLQALLEKYDYNKLKMSMGVHMHRNTITKKMGKLKIKDKEKKKKSK
jgi:DNA-binding NtrC family response regulator